MKTIAGGVQTLFSYETALYLQCSDTRECVMGNEQQQRFVTSYFKFFFSKPIIVLGCKCMKEGRREYKAFIYSLLYPHSPECITNQFKDQLPLDWLAQFVTTLASVSKAGKGLNPGKPEVFQALFLS